MYIGAFDYTLVVGYTRKSDKHINMWQEVKEEKIIESAKDPDKPEGKKIRYKIIKINPERGLTAYQKVYEKEPENPAENRPEEKK